MPKKINPKKSQSEAAVEAATGVPDVWFDRYRRELSPSGDSRALQALLALRAVAHQVEATLEDWIDPFGLSLGQFNVLISLWAAEGHKRTMSDVSRALVSSPANATKLIAKLEEEGLVTREVDDRDKRSVIARLTSKGERRMQAVAPDQIARVEAAMSTVPGWVCEALIEFLGQVRAGFDRASIETARSSQE